MSSSPSHVATPSTILIRVSVNALSEHVQQILREISVGGPLLLELPIRGFWKAGLRKGKRAWRRAPAPTQEPVTRPEVPSQRDREVWEEEAAFSEPESWEPLEDDSEQGSPWIRIAQDYEVGDDVIGRVSGVRAKCILVELLPGAVGRVPIAQISREWVTDPSAHASCGDIVVVRVRSINAEDGEAELSLRDGEGHMPRKPISLAPEEPAFLRDEWEEELYIPEASQKESAIHVRSKGHRTKHSRKKRVPKSSQRTSTESKEGLRSNAQCGIDRLCTETGFRRALRKCWDEFSSDYPLGPFAVGPKVLAVVGGMSPKDAEYLLRACADIATGRVWKTRGREAHALRTSKGGGASQWTRATDSAKAWRCNLANSVSGMRIHWWQVPGRPSRSVEFASVNGHDDFSIPC